MQLLTPRGIGGVAVLLAASSAERDALLACLSTKSGEKFVSAPGAPPRLASLSWSGVVRDEVLVVDRGAEGLELHLHGSPRLIQALEQQFGPCSTPSTGPAQQLLQQASAAVANAINDGHLVPGAGGFETLAEMLRRLANLAPLSSHEPSYG